MGELFSLLQEFIEEQDTDLFLFSGGIDITQAMSLVDFVEKSHDRTNAAMFLCTGGGDPDAAYTIAKSLKRRYKHFTLYIYGFCKSAGTLIALGADEIVMSAHGELGPLDVQLMKRDELVFHSSGLDLLQAMDTLKVRSLDIFENNLLEIIERSGGAITTKTAADIASKLTGELLSPITAQIDPLRLGEVERAMNIAYEYGIRLNANEELIQTLIRKYPSHSFVIDFEEAEKIFANVRPPNEIENAIRDLLTKQLKEDFGRDSLRVPMRNTLVAKLNPIKENEESSNYTGENYENKQNHPDGQSSENNARNGSSSGDSDSGSIQNGVAPKTTPKDSSSPKRVRSKNGERQ